MGWCYSSIIDGKIWVGGGVLARWDNERGLSVDSLTIKLIL